MVLFFNVLQWQEIIFSRAQGNPKNAMISQLIGAGFNILFDYIFNLYFPYGNERSCFCNDWWTVFKCFMATCIFIWKKNDYSFKYNFIEITVEYFKTNYSNRNNLHFLMQISNSVLNIIFECVSC